MKSRTELKEKAKQIYSSNTKFAILGFLIFILITNINTKYDIDTQIYTVKILFFTYSSYYIDNAIVLTLVLSILVLEPLKLGLKNLYLNLGTDEDVDLTLLFSPYKDNFLRTVRYIFLKFLIFMPIVLISLILAIRIIIFAIIILIIGVIVLGLAISQADYYFVSNKEMSAWSCICESISIMSGRKLEYLVLKFSFILWNILESITLGIAGIFVYPYKELTFAAYFKELNNLKTDFIKI